MKILTIKMILLNSKNTVLLKKFYLYLQKDLNFAKTNKRSIGIS